MSDPAEAATYWAGRAAAAESRLAALVAANDCAWQVLEAHYATAGENVANKGQLWLALADLEKTLREIGYGR